MCFSNIYNSKKTLCRVASMWRNNVMCVGAGPKRISSCTEMHIKLRLPALAETLNVRNLNEYLTGWVSSCRQRKNLNPKVFFESSYTSCASVCVFFSFLRCFRIFPTLLAHICRSTATFTLQYRLSATPKHIIKLKLTWRARFVWTRYFCITINLKWIEGKMVSDQRLTTDSGKSKLLFIYQRNRTCIATLVMMKTKFDLNSILCGVCAAIVQHDCYDTPLLLFLYTNGL